MKEEYIRESKPGYKLTDFDSNFSPNEPGNQEAAEQRGWKYDSINEVYVDEDGCLMADKHGQPF